MLPIDNRQIAYNRTARNILPIAIVIHDTGNTSVGADADANFRYFNSGNRDASADFFVDDHSIIRANDYHRYYTWHCGDILPNPGPFYGIIGNYNSLGIEICINKDGNYNKAYQNAVELVQYLMNELNIGIDMVIRHNDVSGKTCPGSMAANNWALWWKFKDLVENGGGLTMSQYEELLNKINNQQTTINNLSKKVNELNKSINVVADYAGIKYNYIDNYMPDYARPVIKKLVDKGALNGEETGLQLSESDLRMLTIMDRLNIYDNAYVYKSIEEVPDYGRSTIQKLIDNEILKGDGKSLGINEQTVKILVYLDRMNLIKFNK